MLKINETLTCHPSRFGLHEYTLKRRLGNSTLIVRGILARTGRAAAEIGHMVMDGRCNLMQAERVAA